MEGGGVKGRLRKERDRKKKTKLLNGMTAESLTKIWSNHPSKGGDLDNVQRKRQGLGASKKSCGPWTKEAMEINQRNGPPGGRACTNT